MIDIKQELTLGRKVHNWTARKLGERGEATTTTLSNGFDVAFRLNKVKSDVTERAKPKVTHFLLSRDKNLRTLRLIGLRTLRLAGLNKTDFKNKAEEEALRKRQDQYEKWGRNTLQFLKNMWLSCGCLVVSSLVLPCPVLPCLIFCRSSSCVVHCEGTRLVVDNHAYHQLLRVLKSHVPGTWNSICP